MVFHPSMKSRGTGFQPVGLRYESSTVFQPVGLSHETSRAGSPCYSQGFVLVSVLWILAIMLVLALGFARRSMMERKVAWYALDHAQALHMARGAAERGIVELGNRLIVDISEKKEGYTGYDQRWAKPLDILHGETHYEATNDPAFEFDACGYRIQDCSSRISVNFAPEEMLNEIDGLSQTVVRKIITRRRGGDDGLEMQSFISIDEVRALSGIDDRDWYGRQPGTGLRDILSVWGQGINLNTASEPVLRAVPRVQGNVVDEILGYRAGGDGELYTEDDQGFRSFADISEKLGITADKLAPLAQFCTTNSEYFTIEAYATRRRGKIVARVTAVVQIAGGFRSVLEWSEDVVRT